MVVTFVLQNRRKKNNIECYIIMAIIFKMTIQSYSEGKPNGRANVPGYHHKNTHDHFFKYHSYHLYAFRKSRYANKNWNKTVFQFVTEVIMLTSSDSSSDTNSLISIYVFAVHP